MSSDQLPAFVSELLRKREERDRALISEFERLAMQPAPSDATAAAMAVADDLASQPYGSAGRTAPAWERAYDPFQRDEGLRAWRTPKHDLEARDFIRAVCDNDAAMLREIADRPHNRALAAEWQRADLATGSIGSPGTGFGAIPIGFANAIETILVRAARLRRYVNVVDVATYGTKIPVQGTKTVAAKHAEAADMGTGVTQPTYTSVTPEAVKLGALIKFSRELLDDSPLQLMNLVTADVAEAIGTLEDLAICQGTTFTNTLLGLTAHATITWTDATETLATLITKYYALGGVLRSRATWIINEAAAQVIAAITGTGERQLFTEFNPPPTAIDDVGGQTGVLIGRPCLVFPTGASGWTADKGFFGDLSGYTLAVRERFRAESSRDSNFATDQVALKVSRREQGIVTQAGRMVLFG